MERSGLYMYVYICVCIYMFMLPIPPVGEGGRKRIVNLPA